MKHGKKRGRPPAGERPGERIVDYPRLSVRVPGSTLSKLRAIGTVVRASQSKVLTASLDRFVDGLPDDQRKLIDDLLRRAGGIFEQPARKSASLPARQETITVLNVDDNDAALFARTVMLRKAGWHVVEAQTGRSALDAVRAHRPDVVLLDVHLPDINGVDVCRQIKADPKTRSVKVVQVSASVLTPLDQLACLESGGADMYLTEPLTRGRLVSVIERLLSRGNAA